jgi:hypothetical protein
MRFTKILFAVVALLAAPAAFAQNTTAPDSNDLVLLSRVDSNGDATRGAVPVTGVFDTVGVGYSTGGAVTQITSRTTGVTLNANVGAITLVSAAGSATPASFTVTDSKVAATDVVVVSQKSGTDLLELHVTATAAGSFRITFFTTGGTTTETPVINFAVIKGAAS